MHANVTTTNPARPECVTSSRGRAARRSLQQRRERFTAVNRGIGHVVDDLDGHGLGQRM